MKTITLIIFNCLLTAHYIQVNGKVARPEDPTGTDKINWWQSGQDELNSAIQSCYNVQRAKNVILFVGDGMGMSTITAARWLQAQSRKVTVHDAPLSWEKFPHVALSKTYCVNVKTADSASTATAMLSGYKARKSTVGVNQNVHHTDCSSMTEADKVKSILHKSHEEGKWTGIVTTTAVTHATPAAAYAHSPDRGWEAEAPDGCTDIATQLVKENDFIRVVLGGGRRFFLPDNETDPEYPEVKGARKDGRNLMKEWLDKKKSTYHDGKAQLVMNETDFKAVDTKRVEYLMGLFEPEHMNMEVDRKDKEKWGEPSLPELTTKAIEILQRSDKGYFLLVEGGRIDMAHHGGLAYRALTETVSLADAVEAADKIAGDDTLIIVTADHSHTFILGGYPSINSDLFDITDDMKNGVIKDKFGEDGKPVMTLSYGNGPGYYYHFMNGSTDTKNAKVQRRNLTEDSITKKLFDKDYRQPAGVPLEKETHGGEDVPIYARGPMSHLFHGSHEQNYIAHVMMYASCVGDNKKLCEAGPRFAGPCAGGSGSGSTGIKGQWSGMVITATVAVSCIISKLYTL